MGRPESAERMSRRQRANAVAEHAQFVDASCVQPGGQPISHSTNRGFKLRRSGDGGAPSGDVSGAGRKERQAASSAACPLINGSSARAPERVIRPPVTSATEGVAHCAAIAGSGVPPAPNAWFGPPFSPSVARGVAHCTLATFSGCVLRLNCDGPASFLESCTVGGGHRATAQPNLFGLSRPSPERVSPISLFACAAPGVGHCTPEPPGVDREDEQPSALMRRADFRRAEKSTLNRETQSA